VIYCVVDEPNVDEEAHSTYAQNIVREILKEVLPYMNIYPDEELTGVNENLTISGTDVFEDETPDDATGDVIEAEPEEGAEGEAEPQN
jgi:stage V sporulation protein D (sporulation-specific penicillin-binding protein)